MRELSGPFRFQQRIYIHLNHVANGQNVNMPVPVKTLWFFCEPLPNSLTHRFIRRFYNNLDLSTGNRLTDNLSPRSGCLLYVAIVANAYYQSQWPARRCIRKPPLPWNSRNTSMTRNIYLQSHQRQAVIKKKQFRVCRSTVTVRRVRSQNCQTHVMGSSSFKFNFKRLWWFYCNFYTYLYNRQAFRKTLRKRTSGSNPT